MEKGIRHLETGQWATQGCKCPPQGTHLGLARWKNTNKRSNRVYKYITMFI